jgi:hypothetical protein
VPQDFVLGTTPWVDFSLTNFWMEDRTSNFLNVGVQVGGYFFERIRVSGRLLAPLDEASDDYYSGWVPLGDGARYSVPERNAALLYGASLGLILASSKTFLFAPGVSLLRTDVNAYGSAAILSLPFEWTTTRHLRVGFELGFGRAFGGNIAYNTGEERERPDGTTLLLQFSLGWSLAAL